nr:hypothetical protein [Tanacetum cinerariifolium]
MRGGHSTVKMKAVMRGWLRLKNLQQTHISQASGSGADEGTGTILVVPDVPTDESEEEISWNSIDEEGDDDDDDDDEGDDGDDGEKEMMMMMMHKIMMIRKTKGMMRMIKRRESFDPIHKTPENTDEEGNGEENLGMNVGREEGQDEEDEEEELYRDININLGRGIQMGDVHTTQEFEDSHVTLTLVNLDGQQQSSSVLSQFVTKMELKKILIEKIEGNKSIHRSNKQRNLYKALVEAYESNKIILDTYGDTFTLKRRHDVDADKDEEPSTGSDRGSKRRRERKEPESASAPKEKASRSAGKSTQGGHAKVWWSSNSFEKKSTKQRQISQTGLTPKVSNIHTICSSLYHGYRTLETKAADYGHIKWIEELVPKTMWIQEPISYDKHALWGISHWGRKRQQFYGFAINRESTRDDSKRRIIAVTELKIVEWHNYKNLDWITARIDDDKLYKFKEGDFKRLRIQDIKDMLLLLVQGKLTNLTVEECFAFNVSLRMFTRSIVIQRCVENC